MVEHKRRLALLAGIMVLLTVVVAVFATSLLYQIMEEHKGLSMRDFLDSQAAIISVVDGDNRLVERSTSWLNSRAISLDQIDRSLRKFSFHHSHEEFLLAAEQDGMIHFRAVSGRRIRPGDPLELAIPIHSSQAVPMQRALRGESGVMIGPDYRGEQVLAAYRPITVHDQPMGMVYKIDIKELRAPYIRGGTIVGLVGLMLIGLGLLVFIRIGDPMIREIQESEKRYRQMVEGANTVILRLDAQGRISFINQYGLDLFGYSMDELLGHSVRGTIEPVGGPGRSLEMLCADGPVTNLETTNLRKDGSSLWLAWSVRIVFDHVGTASEFVCIGHDITRRKLAENARRDSEERFRGIAQASPVGIIITDLDGNLIYSNERVYEMTGLNAVELVGHGWFSQINREDRARVLGSWYGKSTGDVSSKLEFRLESVVGGTLWILGQAVSLHNDSRKVIGYVVTLTDITNLKEAEGQYKRLTAALDQAGEAVIITDAGGVITYVNPAFESMSGYSRQEAVGRKPNILKSGHHDAKFYACLWATLEKGKVWTGRFKNMRKDGVLYEVDTTIGPVRDETGEIINYVSVSRDVTDQLLLEAQLRQAQKLESIGQLSAGIAHEINTPIQYVGDNLRYLHESFQGMEAILSQMLKFLDQVRAGDVDQGMIRVIDKACQEADLDFTLQEVPRAVEQSLEGVERVANIVRSMKEFSHPGDERKIPSNINRGLENTITVARNEWKYVAEMVLDLSPDLPLVPCLVSELNQVFLNMIVNASQAIAEKLGDAPADKGTITVRTYQEEDMVVVEVEDTGSGIPKTVQDRIFDPFFTTKEVGKGTGQGLAIAHNVIVVKHNGKISFKSEEGVGTTFILKLPI